MLNELSVLNAFVAAYNSPQSSGNNDVISIKNACASFHDSLEQGISVQDSTEKLALFIRHTQIRLTVLADKAYNRFIGNSAADAPDTRQQLLLETGDSMCQGLHYLHTYFLQYFDLKASIPIWLIRNNHTLLSREKLIVHALQEKQIDPELSIILDGFLDCLQQTNTAGILTWEQFDYLSKITGELEQFLSLPGSENETLRLIRMLIGQNFNAGPFYEFMLSYISRITGHEEAPYEEQIISLLGLLKIFEDIRPESNIAYNMELLPIAESLCAAIRRDVQRIEKMKEIFMPYTIGQAQGKTSSFYFEITATLEELLFMFSVWIALGVVKTRYKAHLFSFIERHIKTERTRNPSPDYMRNLFPLDKGATGTLVRRVRSRFMQAVNYIDTHYSQQLKF